jgi:uncharacterized protein
VHQDGLVHVSQLADRFVKDPHEVAKVGDKLKVRVLEVDLVRKRIALTARSGSVDTRGPARGPESKDKRPAPNKSQPQAPQFANNAFATLLKR